jgi:hypothetical protein
MRIRKPVAEVFTAFVDPVVTTKFGFTKSSGKLASGKDVRWDREMYAASAPVSVKVVDPNKRILVDSVGGFTMVLAGLKALLERDVVLGLVADHYPDAHRRAPNNRLQRIAHRAAAEPERSAA